MLIIRDKKTRSAKRVTVFSNGWTVETYWNWRRDVMSWVTQIKDADGNLRDVIDGDLRGTHAMYAGSDGGPNTWAKMNHEQAITVVRKRAAVEMERYSS
jgi:hypothetical protein